MVCEIGEKFGRLTVVGEAARRSGQRYVDCMCACGARVTVAVKNLRSGDVKSCGCLRRARMKEISKAKFE